MGLCEQSEDFLGNFARRELIFARIFVLEASLTVKHACGVGQPHATGSIASGLHCDRYSLAPSPTSGQARPTSDRNGSPR